MTQQLYDWLNAGAIIVMAGGAVWLTKTIVNDMKHDITALRESSAASLELLKDIKELLKQ